MDDEYEKLIVASGIWLYDGVLPKTISIIAIPAKFAPSRYDDFDQIIEDSPIPITRDGFVYVLSSGSPGFATLEEAKEWADIQPWGPVQWSGFS